ncbi:amino acid adenylation domain-containing protein [Floridanema evergladense]|uniref:Amino acid adenylation domain-containing protein n=1 Tax=Floridaenema evergladense BLCC-F167 TaxID=3153639 RepID=A0ABV4WSB1_9CYAN
MNLTKLLQHLSAKNVELWVDEDKLRYRAPEKVLTPDLLTQIKQYKSEIIQILGKSTDNLATYPLSYGQEALWFLYQLAPNSVAYNVTYAAKLVNNLNIPALKQACQLLVERHPVFRTTFTTINDKPMQTVRENQPVCFTVQEIFDASKDEINNLLLEESSHVFNLENGESSRFHLLVNDRKNNTEITKEYIFSLAAHHIITDFWSLEIVVSELKILYEAITAGKTPQLPAQNCQYRDYAIWSRQMLAGKIGEDLYNYWLRKLSGELPLLNLPTDRPRPAIQTYNGANHFFTIEEELTQKLTQLAQQEGTSLYTVFLAGLQLLLLRYTDQEDILIGSPTVNRNRSEFERVVGYFTNPVVLRTDLSGNPTFQELLGRSRSCILEALDHQDYPFALLVEQLQPVRDPSYSPLCQVMLAWERPHQSQETASLMENDGLIVESIIAGEPGAAFDLTLTIFDLPGTLKAKWNYNTDLFDGRTIERMTGHFQTLLEAIVGNPETPISQLPILTTTEQQQLLVEWNDTQTDYPVDKCLHQLFETQVEKTPDAVAVVFENQQLTYSQLNNRANQLAHYLRSLSVDADALVGICVERSIEMVVGLLGILKAGGAYLPLDPEYPQERLQFMLQDAQVSVILTQQRLLEKLKITQENLICLDTDWQTIQQWSQSNPICKLAPENLAYVIYTSGSTGQPKGAMNTHKGICNRLIWMQEAYQLTTEDVVLQKTPFSFDVSVWEFFWTLCNGSRLVIARPEGHRDREYLVNLIAQQQVTTLHFVPSMLQVFLESENLAPCQSLRRVICSGEALSLDLQAKYFERLGCELHNLYGPTEAAIDVTYWQCQKESQLTTVPLGRPIANTQIYILDSYLQPVPIGVPGELHIGGAGLARGYLNRPELTKEKFITNPFDNSERLYKTGDLARYLPDGNIEYLGRIDHQVKIRGFRIELGEIEAVLNQHPQVQSSVVIAREDNSGEKRLVAYLVSDSEVTPTINELREYLKAKLPEYMIPSAFVFLETLPLTPNGKIDRKALPKPETRSGIETKLIAPRTPEEETLATIWKQVLRVEQIGIHDNFFELGGDSILSIQIISRAKKAGIELTVKQIFSHQTIAELARVAGTRKTTQIPQRLITGLVELTPIQQWFFEQNPAEPHHFNQSFLLTTPPDFHPEYLKPIWQELLKHHDALRLRFTQTQSGWQQIHATPTEDITIHEIDLSNIAETDELSAEIEKQANRIQASLDLAENLLQIAYFNLGKSQPGRLLIIIHHLVVDGVSWRILLEDFQTAYQQITQNQPIQLPAKTTSFQDWAKHLKQYAQSEKLKSELTYWLKESDVVSPIPVDYSQGENTVASAKNICVSLNGTQTQALIQEVPAAYKTQINDILLTALVRVISKWTNAKAVLFNLEGHGREEEIIGEVDLSRTIGWFTTIFPVLIELEDQHDWGTIIKSVKEQIRAIPHKGIGYGILRYLCDDPEINQQFKAAKIVEITFNYLGQFSQTFNQSSGLQLAKEASRNNQSLANQRSALLDINAIISNECLQINWTYSSNIHQHRTIEKIAQEFVATLQEIITHCLNPENSDYTVSDFPLIKLNQLELEQVWTNLSLTATQKRNIEDIYPLSPMQQGMMFESLSAPESGVYFEQMICTLSGNINVSTLEQAWQQVVAHHSVFRSAFVWSSLPQPVQIVFRQVEVKLQTQDWRELSPSQQQQELEAFLKAQRQLGFDFTQAPLLRLHLIQLEANTYQLAWSFHHILLDGWSLPLVFQDLWQSYQAISQGKTVEARPSISYRHYIAWWQQQEIAPAEAFWRTKLQGFTAPTPLMIEQALAGRTTGEASYREQELHLGREATAKAVSFVREHQLTLNNLVQATWALLLSRYSQEFDVVFGATVSGRPAAIAGVESMVGLFINTLPMRVEITEQTELLELLKGLQAQLIESEQFSYSSLVEIQGWSDVPRGTALFDSIVVFENYPIERQALETNGGFSLTNFRGIEQTNYPLTLVVMPGEQLLVKISYDANRFEYDSINRMLGHFQTLLAAIVENPQTPISQLPILTTTEQQQLLVEWNDTQTDYPIDQCLHQLFEQQVEKTPDAVAVIFEDQQLTYSQLNDRANQLAHYLRSLGVDADVLVGICVERSLEMVIGLLGILKAGGAYLPLDPEYPQERLQFMLDDSQVKVLLTQQQVLDKLPATQANILCLDDIWSQISQNPQDNPNSEVSSSHLANLIYTSGSTGKPKGVMVEHRGLCNLAMAQIQAFALDSNSRVLQFASLSFDASISEIIMAFGSGATLYLGSKDSFMPGQPLMERLRDDAITHVTLPPSALAVLPVAELPTLQTIVVAGEACAAQLIQQWSVGRHFFNAYGPTEASVCATIAQCGDGDGRISIGRPIANTQVYILDFYLQPVPVGVPGELHIGGAGLARGYLNRKELTQEKFITNPFDNSEQLYKTGDLARYLPDGNIEYLGRIDNQVKIRGFRIELGEIEALLSQCHQVQAAVVIAREDIPGDKRLVAYIVPQPDTALTVSELREFLKVELPDYMIPSAFVILESLPLTPNGKVDRRTLLKHELTIQPKDDYVMPTTEVEKIIALVWQKALKLEKVGIYDNFFEMGGHSLLMVQINKQLEEMLNLQFPLTDMFKYPDIHNLSKYLTDKLQEETRSEDNDRSQTHSNSKASRNQRSQVRQQYRSQKRSEK